MNNLNTFFCLPRPFNLPGKSFSSASFLCWPNLSSFLGKLMKSKCNLGSLAELKLVHSKAVCLPVRPWFSVTQKSSVVPQLPPAGAETAAAQRALLCLQHWPANPCSSPLRLAGWGRQGELDAQSAVIHSVGWICAETLAHVPLRSTDFENLTLKFKIRVEPPVRAGRGMLCLQSCSTGRTEFQFLKFSEAILCSKPQQPPTEPRLFLWCSHTLILDSHEPLHCLHCHHSALEIQKQNFVSCFPTYAVIACAPGESWYSHLPSGRIVCHFKPSSHLEHGNPIYINSGPRLSLCSHCCHSSLIHRWSCQPFTCSWCLGVTSSKHKGKNGKFILQSGSELQGKHAEET